MSILIKGMAMPKDQLYPVHATIYADGTVFTGHGIGQTVKEAVPVPPHGRLGDLDRILEIIDGIWDCNDMTFKPNDHCCDVPKDCHGCKWAETKRAIREIVANAPTIIPVEEKKV